MVMRSVAYTCGGGAAACQQSTRHSCEAGSAAAAPRECCLLGLLGPPASTGCKTPCCSWMFATCRAARAAQLLGSARWQLRLLILPAAAVPGSSCLHTPATPAAALAGRESTHHFRGMYRSTISPCRQ